ncbi:MAG: glycoside hydrolase family 15 protein [Ilumatobacteraceae bacterium]
MSDDASHRPPLEPRRLLGEGVGAALIRPDGEIDWWCPNRFEAEPAFWSLLDPHGGCSRWVGADAVARDECPAGPTTRTVVRIGGTQVELWDGLVGVPGGSKLVRLVRATDGEHRLVNLVRAGGFETPPAPWVTTPAGAASSALMIVGASASLDGDGGVAVDVTASPDGWTGFAVVATDRLPPGGIALDLSRILIEAEVRDRRATARLRLPHRHPQRATDGLQVMRALTDRTSGAPVAAPTTSLPEAPGGTRQFDYRYSWLRDSGLSMAIAAALGDRTTASGYVTFLGRLLGDELHPVSTSDGGRVPDEREVPGVAGWAESRPVRVGNGAWEQQQLDALATVIDAVWFHVSSGAAMDGATWAIVDDLAGRLVDAPFEPTSGVWERRDPKRLVSEEIARWHGLDRALRLRRRYRPWLRRKSWAERRAEARQRVTSVVDPATGRLPASFDGDDEPDAATLMAVISGLLDRRDQRATRLVRATIDALGHGPFLRRYPPRDDGFSGIEGAFVPASWWAVTALAIVGDVEAATGRADELCIALPRLQPEEWDVDRAGALGNTPLLWSHMEAARALYVLQREELRRRVGTVGLGMWSFARYVRLRLARPPSTSR